MPETRVARAVRHVAEAERRVVGQELLVSQLELHGHAAPLPVAHALLEQLHGLLLEYRRHLDHERAEPPRR